MYLTHSATQTLTSDPQSAPASYGEALRVIGQDLAGLFPRTLEIVIDGISFEARGESHPNPFEAIRESIFHKTWRRWFKKPQPIETDPQRLTTTFTRAYGPEKIEQLDRLYSARRNENSGRADGYSLAERLRTMGAIVDSKNGRLKRLSKERDRLFVEYWDQQGNVQSARLTTVIMYRSQHRPDQQHQSAPLELWEGYDF